MWKKPDMINLQSNNMNFKKGFLFWIQEEGMTNLYRFELEDDNLEPVKITNLPNLKYKNSEKKEHMLKFLEENNICFKIENENVIIYDDSFDEYKVIQAPLYIRKNEECFLMESKYSMEFPTKETIDAAYEIFRNIYEKVRQEEIIYDFYKLSLDGGISAYMENYRLPLTLLDEDVFYAFDIDVKNNSEDGPYNEYTYTYMEKSIFKSQNKVIFNREEISKKITKDGEIYCYLPKAIASVVIGKNGCNIKDLIYKIGVRKMNINEQVPNQK